LSAAGLSQTLDLWYVGTRIGLLWRQALRSATCAPLVLRTRGAFMSALGLQQWYGTGENPSIPSVTVKNEAENCPRTAFRRLR
jgi:hypothetical protein